MRILANDAAWGGWGWALVDEAGPIACGHLRLSTRTWRWSALARVLSGAEPVHADGGLWSLSGRTISTTSSDFTWPELLRAADRVVVEQAPAVYSGRGRGRTGNQAVIGYGLGSLAGPLLTSATQCAGYPWEVDTRTWRSWWGGSSGGGRAEIKARAVGLVRSLGWHRCLEPFAGGEDEGARGDVAEAILMGVGATRHLELAPRGPRRGPDVAP